MHSDNGREIHGFRRALGHGGIATAGRLIGALILNKTIALLGGPTSLAAFGQIQNLIVAGSALTGAALSNGTTSISASQERDAQRETLHEARRLSLQGSLILLPLLFFTPFLLHELLPSIGSSILLSLLLALAIFATGQIQLALALLNAQRRLGAWSSLQLISALIQPIAAFVGFQQGGITAALAAFLLSNILPLFLLAIRTWSLFPHLPHLTLSPVQRNLETRKRILGFGAVQGLSLLIAPFSLTWVRQLLVSSSGWDIAGQWQAIWKLSEISISLLATALTAHLLPTMAKTATFEERRALLNHTLLRVFLIAAAISTLLMITREWVLALAFDKKFISAAPAMAWQLIGDIFRMANWTLGLTLLARERLVQFAGSELFSVALLIAFSSILIPRLGLSGATIAYLAEGSLLFVFLLVMARRAIR